MALYTSDKNILKIETFMKNYLGIRYDGKEKLTHFVMRQFLLDKGHKCPNKAIFSKITKPDILSGRILIVKDKSGQKIGYYNPRMNLNRLFQELQMQKDPVELEKRRAEILGEQNCLLLSDDTIVSLDEEDDTIEFRGKTRDNRFVFTKRKRAVPARRR